jgi:electron transport complex protein RnfE
MNNINSANKINAQTVIKLAKEGFLINNPICIQILGICPALATSTTVSNGVGMGLSATFVLIFSNLLISLLRKIIPKQIRIASYIVVISGFVTMLEMFLKAYIPNLEKSLGLFIPLIVVNCIILARAESFASKNNALSSVLDGMFMGLGFTLAMFLLSSIREITGSGTFLGSPVFPAEFAAKIIVSPPGAFISLGILIAVFKTVIAIIENRSNAKPANKNIINIAGNAVVIENIKSIENTENKGEALE